MAAGRWTFPATLLPSGKVLVSGGIDSFSAFGTSGAELYDPATGTWSAAQPLPNQLTLLRQRF
ncbi:MAG TPA: kelch repeat-containing protein [Anaeromyxobacteraceae bacterium]|nr:kelch repeat-containing protein [Anaeromyxobacteraceae bacterium]